MSQETEASLVAQMVKRLPTMQETWVRSLSWEDPLENEMAEPKAQACCLRGLYLQLEVR